jgi:DNA-binding transcriptional LysR family regulator
MRMSEFTLTGMRAVREVARRGSFSAAADRLGYTQSAVSRQVALTEAAAGRPLFERHARGVRLTDAGRLVVRHAEAMLAEAEAAQQGLADLGARAPGRLRVGAFSTAMAALVPRAIATFAGREPETQVVLREGPSTSLLGRVARGRLDMAVIASADEPPEGVVVTSLLDDPLLLAVHSAHPLAGRPSVAADELRRERWIAGSVDPGSVLLGAWTAASWSPDIAYVAKDWTAKLGLVAAGQGVTIVPGLAAPALPHGVAVVRIDHPAAQRPTGLATAERAVGEPRAESLAESLRDAAAELGAEVRRRLRA